MEQSFLEFKGITKIFPGVVALDDVSFSIAKETVHVIIGENGAGKSTLMKIISGAHAQTSGEMWLDGEKLDLASPEDVFDFGDATLQACLCVYFRKDSYLSRGTRAFIDELMSYYKQETIVVDTAEGKYVMTGDYIPILDNYKLCIPNTIHNSLREWYASYDKIKALNAQLLPGHDLSVFERKQYG